MKLLLPLILIAAVVGCALAADDPAAFDQRFAVVATDTSGWDGPVMPMQGPDFFDPPRTAWWYNYSPRMESNQVPGLVLFWPGYQRLYMFWRAGANTSDAVIQNYASAAKAADPTRTIWWAMSNEPNDRGQANTPAADFAQIYLKHHKNLRIGDPTCKIMGPGLLNWTFTNSSCYQTGKSWYEEFREAWAADPECTAYSQSINGTDYPPQDAFCMHSYHIHWPDDWRWCRDELTTAYNDLQTYPETAGLKIWNTEFASLTSATRTQAADMMSALVLWMREQPWMEKWFLFITHSDKYGTWVQTELFNDDGTTTQLGEAYRDLQLLPADASFYHYPFHAAYDETDDYVRSGWSKTIQITEGLNVPSFKLHLVEATQYLANTMRGRTFAPEAGSVYRVRFNYLANYDNTLCTLEMDTSESDAAWVMDELGLNTGYVEVDLSADPAEWISFGLYINSDFTYPFETGGWNTIVSNVMLFTAPGPPVVTDEGQVTTSSESLSAEWTAADGGKQPVVEYQYAIGSAEKGTDVVGWTSTGTSTSFSRNDLTLQDYVTYYISVKAKDSDGNWGGIGCSDGITSIPTIGSLAEAKISAPAAMFAIDDLVVSAVFADRFYVQETDRSMGVGVVGVTDAAVGDDVSIGGELAVVDGEAVILGEAMSATPGGTPEPVAMSNRVSGGGAFGIQSAVVDDAAESKHAGGLSNVGLLMKLWGTVTHIDPDAKFAYIDDGAQLNDGSGFTGVRVWLAGLPVPVQDSFSVITGVMSTALEDGNVCRLFRPRSSRDLAYEEIDNYLGNPGFESGGLVGWQTIGAAGEVVDHAQYGSIYPHSGANMFACHGYYVANSGTIYQVAVVQPGQSYAASVFSSVYHWDASLEAARNRIGIDPTGGTDPDSPNVAWSDWDQNPAWTSAWHEIIAPQVTASGDEVTVFLQYQQQGLLGYNINCFDDALLSQSTT